MYKHASRNLQRRFAVDRPLPTGGYIGGSDDSTDVLSSPATMSVDSLRQEQKQLRAELAQIEQSLAVAKALNCKPAVSSLGQRKAALCSRLSAVGKALSAIDGPSELTRLLRAANEIVGREMVDRIVARANEMRAEPSES